MDKKTLYALTSKIFSTLKKLGIKPKRTIRFIAWSGEEMGLPGNGAAAYR